MNLKRSEVYFVFYNFFSYFHWSCELNLWLHMCNKRSLAPCFFFFFFLPVPRLKPRALWMLSTIHKISSPRDGSTVKSTVYSSKDLGQIPALTGLKMSVTPLPRAMDTLFWPPWHQKCTWYTCIQEGKNNHAHKIKFKKESSLVLVVYTFNPST